MSVDQAGGRTVTFEHADLVETDLTELIMHGDGELLVPARANRDPRAEGDYERLIEAYQHLYEVPAEQVPAEPVVRTDGRTLFTSSGIQRLYGPAFEGEPYPDHPIFIEQPVIRTNHFGGVNPDSFTSFVNPGTFFPGAAPEQHAAALIRLVEAVRAFAPADKAVTVRLSDKVGQWAEEPFPIRFANIAIDGLSVGDAIFMPHLPTVGGPGTSVSEFGLGRERLMHCIEGKDTVEAVADCPVTEDSAPAIDAVRTMTLMTAGGVVPSNKDHGYQLRRFSKRVAELGLPEGVDSLEGLVARSYADWAQFMDLPVDAATTARIISQEFGRNVSSAILGSLAVSGKVPQVDINRGVGRTLASLRYRGVAAERLASLVLPRGVEVGDRPQRTLIVCDYENERDGYTFPNLSMGATENRIWRFAESATAIEGLRVVIMGPRWKPEYVPGAIHVPYRLDSPENAQRFLTEFGKADFLYAGHEYFDKDEWTGPFLTAADNIITFQDYPYVYSKKSFDGRTRFLFCTSDDFLELYARQKPIKGLTSHTGPNQEPYRNPDTGDHLIWMGRLDGDKVPHIAIQAAALLNRRIVVLGRTVQDPAYGEFLAPYLTQPHVEYRGELYGPDKMAVMTSAAAAVYTVSPAFREAAAGVLSEYVSSGIPVAGITWRGNDAVLEAIDAPELGRVVNVSGSEDDAQAAARLAEAIAEVLQIDHAATFATGNPKYDPVKLTRKVLDTVLTRSAVSEKY